MTSAPDMRGTSIAPAPAATSRRRFCGAVGAALAALGQGALAQARYPDRPIKVLIGFAPGGGADAVARLVCSAMAEELGQPLVVDNRPGANANIATDAVAKAPADGYTLLYNTSALAISPALYARLPYDPRRDLVPVAQAAAIPLLLVVSPRMPVKNVKEFVAYLAAKRGQLNYASSGRGNITHLAAAEILRLTGSEANHVPYKSEAPAITDLLGGHIDFYVGNANTLIPQAQERKLVPLAVTSLRRMPQLPDVPTLDESIAKGLEMVAWSGFMAPRGTPPEVVARIAAAVEAATRRPAVRKRVEAGGAQVRWAGAGGYGRLIDAELQRWSRAVKAAGIQPE
ncbi:tripartite tricarboxylate transporter substrate binding protein [Xylophilus sp.]|uniref:tripartite tricarboxylate transporter substrate binding protein n=1 Tax=Xylophilus sp. TaxID=2653893 RepID=UPI0013B73911|nr:tripartite tricarboxylate transporter substrate binding protein [Xylophilus sp.]KAF1048570.1 MAG: hypothetical protein GAK38_01321 [Xylophilus sp.]